jgi:hypothetical protein
MTYYKVETWKRKDETDASFWYSEDNISWKYMGRFLLPHAIMRNFIAALGVAGFADDELTTVTVRELFNPLQP